MAAIEIPSSSTFPLEPTSAPAGLPPVPKRRVSSGANLATNLESDSLEDLATSPSPTEYEPIQEQEPTPERTFSPVFETAPSTRHLPVAHERTLGEGYKVAAWWRGSVLSTNGDEIEAILIDDYGARTLAVIDRQEFVDEDPEYPFPGQTFILTFLIKNVRGIVQRTRTLVIDPPARWYEEYEEKVPSELESIFGKKGDPDAL